MRRLPERVTYILFFACLDSIYMAHRGQQVAANRPVVKFSLSRGDAEKQVQLPLGVPVERGEKFDHGGILKSMHTYLHKQTRTHTHTTRTPIVRRGHVLGG